MSGVLKSVVHPEEPQERSLRSKESMLVVYQISETSQQPRQRLENFSASILLSGSASCAPQESQERAIAISALLNYKIAKKLMELSSIWIGLRNGVERSESSQVCPTLKPNKERPQPEDGEERATESKHDMVSSDQIYQS